jgi:alcohol dehydrogenase class IV
MGSIFNVPHGMCNAMLLTEVPKFSVDAAKDRYADCARAIGFADKSDDDEVAVSKLLVGLDKYNKVLEVPSVKSFGIDVSEYLKVAERMAAEAISSGAPNNNPRIPNKEEIIAIYKAVVCE